MYQSDIPPHKIRKFLYKQGYISISTLQIRKIQLPFEQSDWFSETDQLINYITENKDLYRLFEKKNKKILFIGSPYLLY